MSDRVGRIVDSVHGWHGYKWLCPKWPHIQINCFNTVSINSNYKITHLPSTWLCSAFSGVLLLNIYLGCGSQHPLLQVRKRRLRDDIQVA